jgi:hypothetical protein
LVVPAVVISTPAVAWDPYPYPLSVEQAVKSANCVITGFVESAAVEEKTDSEIMALAKVKIDSCFRGSDCRHDSIMKISYVTQTHVDPHASIEFIVGSWVLLALRNQCSDVYSFESDFGKLSLAERYNVDVGYNCDYIGGIPESEKNSYCQDMMFHSRAVPISNGAIRSMLK